MTGNEYPAKQHASNPEILNLDNDSPGSKPNHATPDLTDLPKDYNRQYIITRKVKVDAVEHFNSTPRCWPVPKMDTVYVLDFTDDARVLGRNDTVIRKPKGLDTFLKAEVRGYPVFSKHSTTDDLDAGSRLMGKGHKWQYLSQCQADPPQ